LEIVKRSDDVKGFQVLPRKSEEKENRAANKVDKEEYKKKNAVGRFFSWIESCKKVFPRYEIKETSYLGVVTLAAVMRLHEVLE
jgi:transposase